MKKYDAKPYQNMFAPEFKYSVRSRLGDHLVAVTKTKKMAERIVAALES